MKFFVKDTGAQRKRFPQDHTANMLKGCLFQAFGGLLRICLRGKGSVARTSLGKPHVLLDCLPSHPGFLGNRSLKPKTGMKPTSSKEQNRKWPQLVLQTPYKRVGHQTSVTTGSRRGAWC